MIKLTEQQQKIVEHDVGPALVYAVAGAGKTTTMVHRIERLVREGVFEPSRILATTFNRAAAGEIRTKLRRWRYCESVKATTLHAFGYSIIRQAVRRRHLRPVRVLDQSDKLLYEALRLARRKEVWFKNELEQLDKEDFLTYVSACKGNLEYADLSAAKLPLSGLKFASQAVASTASLSWYVDLYRFFEEARVKGNWITFDDMLLLGWEVLIKHPDVLSYVRHLFHCVLVDEFQDINFVQSEILDLIVAEHRNYMAIGDDDQTIYEWRGANPKFILGFEARYEATKFLISDNFRSPASQIVLANEVIQHNKKRADKFLSLTQGFDGRVFLHSEASEEKMARHLVDQIELALKDGLAPEELVILIRIYAQTPYIEQVMIERRIPYLIVGSVPFYRRTEVVTLLNYCHLALIDKKLQAGEELTVKEIERFTKAWRNVYNRPKRYLSRVISDKIRETMIFNRVPFERALAVMSSDISFWVQEKLFKFLRTLEWLKRNLDMSATMLLDKLEKRLEYKYYLEESSGFPETGQAKAATVDAFIKYAKGKGNILEFIEHLQDISFGQLHTMHEHGNDERRFVKMMTIFRAKGLEWDTVFVPHCNRGTIPFGKDKERLEEERRLLYVAMTRSRRYLHLYWTSPISPFLVEAKAEETLDEVLKLQKILTSAANEWESQELPLVASGIERFRLKRFFSDWWQIPAEKKQEIADLMLASYKEKGEASKEEADKGVRADEIKFWERFSARPALTPQPPLPTLGEGQGVRAAVFLEMIMIELDGGIYSNIDLYLLSALSLSAVTRQPFQMQQVGLRAKSFGLTPFHLTAIEVIGSLCAAEVKGNLMQAKTLAFTPREAPRAAKMVIDTGAITGRPSPASVVPIIEALIPVLASAEADSLIELRGANTTPFSPSAFWVRETLAPMLHELGINIGVDIEKWGWYPDGGGITTLLVEKKSEQTKEGRLSWKEHGDLVALWVVVALSPRLKESIGQQMEQAFKKAIVTDRLPLIDIDLQRVRSPGPGSGLFMALEFEHVTAGFEAINYRGMSAQQVAQDAAAAMSHYYWSDRAFEPELARALMIPLALTGRESRFTTSEFTTPMYILADIIPRFLPIKITLTPHHSGGEVIMQPNP